MNNGGTLLKRRAGDTAGDVIARYLARAQIGIDRAEHPAYVTVTSALVDAGATGKGRDGKPVGWTIRQIQIIDPASRGRKPTKGWRHRSDGRQITWAAAVAFLTTTKRKQLRPNPGSIEEARVIDRLLRLTGGQKPRAPYHESHQVVIRQTQDQEDTLALLLGDHLKDRPPWE